MIEQARKRKSIITRKRVPAGSPPGTLVSDPAALTPSIRLIAYDEAGLEEIADATPQDIENALKGERHIWVDVIGVGDADLVARIGGIFGVDPLALEDVMHVHQRPKVEDFKALIYIVMHMTDGRSLASREQFSLFLGRNFVLTFQERPGDCLDPVRERLRRGALRIRTADADYLAYAILDTILDAYFPLAERLGERLEDLEDAITGDPGPRQIAELHAIKRDLLSAKRSLWPAREVMNVLRDEDCVHFSAETRRFLRDTQDHVLQLIDIVETYRELASGLLDLYLSSMSNRMNEVMKVLTIIATIFIPLSFLAGVWGMNFDGMPELHWKGAYFAALGFMAVIAIGLLGWFKWKDWL